ncbi:MAG: hypothetical protein K8W52_38705 [Deltaproteobacteria bacterium]|nr:hypothetical protein [Deltaproteobacteria bacterium]
MIDDADLDAFQATLTALLVRRLPAAAMAHALATDPAFAAHRAWVMAFDPAALDVSAMLAARWVSRAED